MSTQVTPEAPPEPHDFLAVQASPEFAGLRKTLRGFIFPMTVAFFLWYALYVILSAYARDFMGTKVVGNINVALIFGLLQFVTTFLIAWLYARFASSKLDAVADGIRAGLDNGPTGPGAGPAPDSDSPRPATSPDSDSPRPAASPDSVSPRPATSPDSAPDSAPASGGEK